MATPMMVGSNGGTAHNDVLGVFFVMAAVALWMRTADMPTTDTRAYRGGSIIAAVAAGLAVSVKLNLLAPVGALTLAAIALTPSGRRRSATGWWIGGLVLAGGYWYARNLIAIGNPLPWFSFGVLPTPHPPPLQQGNYYSLADYATYPRILRHWLIPALNMNLGPWWPALVAAAVRRSSRVSLLQARPSDPGGGSDRVGLPGRLHIDSGHGVRAVGTSLLLDVLHTLRSSRTDVGAGRHAAGPAVQEPAWQLGGGGRTRDAVRGHGGPAPPVDAGLQPGRSCRRRGPGPRGGGDRGPQTVVADPAPAPARPRHRRDAGSLARAGRGRSGLLGYPGLPEAPIYLQVRAGRRLQGVALGSGPAPRANRPGGHLRLLLRLSPLGSRRFQSRRVHGPARSRMARSGPSTAVGPGARR